MRHPALAVPSILLALLAEVVTLFYFIGAGRLLKDSVAETGLGDEPIARARMFHSKASRLVVLNLALLVGLFVLGGAAGAGRMSILTHGLASLAGVAAYALTSSLSMSYLWRTAEVVIYVEAASETKPTASP